MLCACEKKKVYDKQTEDTFPEEKLIEKNEINEIEKGYNLTIEESERNEAEEECKTVMQSVFDIYEKADKGHDTNVLLGEEVMCRIQDKVSRNGCPVTTDIIYSDMLNYEIADSFLNNCLKGKSGEMVLYEIQYNGGISRNKYIYDGTDMYVLSSNATWTKDNKPNVSYISFSRIEQWSYTERGWFCYELCVPEYPDVTEVVDGSCMIRVKPMTEQQKSMSDKYVRGLGYQGNNILCSNWDENNMEQLDYNGMFEYLYTMKYKEKFPSEAYCDGIPKEEFENLIMEYMPITSEKIRKYAEFDEENNMYVWARLSCINYTPNFFGTSLPEVTDIRENEDGTVTLTVNAVCEMGLCDDAVITHELKMRISDDGKFKYLRNTILNNGIYNIPPYQYRIVNRE